MSTKQRLNRCDEFLVAPLRGDACREYSAHAGAADEVDRHAVLAQRAHDAEVRKAARAPAREHEPNGAAGQHPHHAVVIGRAPHVVMGYSGKHGMPARRRAVHDSLLVQEEQLRVAHAAVDPARSRSSLRRRPSRVRRAARRRTGAGKAESTPCHRRRRHRRRSRSSIRARGTIAGCGCLRAAGRRHRRGQSAKASPRAGSPAPGCRCLRPAEPSRRSGESSPAAAPPRGPRAA